MEERQRSSANTSTQHADSIHGTDYSDRMVMVGRDLRLEDLEQLNNKNIIFDVLRLETMADNESNGRWKRILNRFQFQFLVRIVSKKRNLNVLGG